jgi:hypothetical protein
MLAGVKPWASSMIRASVVILAALSPLLAVPPARARACSCRMPSFEEQRAEADAIFEGRVDEIRSVGGDLVVVLHVTQAWRGVAQERVEVSTASNEAACGFTFEVGQHYLVYATSPESTLRVSLCSRTALADDASEDRQLLGSGTIPVEVADDEAQPEARRAPPATRAGCASCAAMPARAPAMLHALAILVALALRGRSRARS